MNNKEKGTGKKQKGRSFIIKNILPFSFLLLTFSFVGAHAADEANKPADQQDSYYWQGTQLYNLGRLGEAFDSFEKAIQRKQNTKEAEAYLLQIRQEIVTNAKKRAEERATLNYSGNSPDSALNVTYVQKGYIKVTLQAKFLFDENSAALKTASLDVLNRLAELVQAKEGNRVELIMVDELDDSARAKDIDAERSLLVFAFLNFKRINTNNIVVPPIAG